MGELVYVTVTVRNKALVSASQVNVMFWRGDPDNCFDLECTTSTLGTHAHSPHFAARAV
jgi:hypothetical protein